MRLLQKKERESASETAYKKRCIYFCIVYKKIKLVKESKKWIIKNCSFKAHLKKKNYRPWICDSNRFTKLCTNLLNRYPKTYKWYPTCVSQCGQSCTRDTPMRWKRSYDGSVTNFVHLITGRINGFISACTINEVKNFGRGSTFWNNMKVRL